MKPTKPTRATPAAIMIQLAFSPALGRTFLVPTLEAFPPPVPLSDSIITTVLPVVLLELEVVLLLLELELELELLLLLLELLSELGFGGCGTPGTGVLVMFIPSTVAV